MQAKICFSDEFVKELVWFGGNLTSGVREAGRNWVRRRRGRRGEVCFSRLYANYTAFVQSVYSLSILHASIRTTTLTCHHKMFTFY